MRKKNHSMDLSSKTVLKHGKRWRDLYGNRILTPHILLCFSNSCLSASMQNFHNHASSCSRKVIMNWKKVRWLLKSISTAKNMIFYQFGISSIPLDCKVRYIVSDHTSDAICSARVSPPIGILIACPIRAWADVTQITLSSIWLRLHFPLKEFLTF